MTTEIAKRPPKTDLAVYLESNIGELAKSCTSTVRPEMMLQAANIILAQTPELQRCTPDSILNSIVQCASLGLSLTRSLGEAYLIPYGKECQFQPGFRGIAKLARANGKIESIVARVVYQKDEFKVVHEPVSAVYHTPFLGLGRGVIAFVYSVVTYSSGRKTYEVMTTEEVENVRQSSKQKDGVTWRKWWGEMAKKTVIKRHCKQLDSTPELAQALEIDNREYDLEAPVIPQNNSGFGRGQYANDHDQMATERMLREFCEDANTRWYDNWTAEDGAMNPAVTKPLLNVWQLDAHLIKWACTTGRLDAASMEVGRKGVGLYTGILWHRTDDNGELVDRGAMLGEMHAYERKLWREASEGVKRASGQKPDPLEEAVQQQMDLEPEMPAPEPAPKPAAAPLSPCRQWVEEMVEETNRRILEKDPDCKTVTARQVATSLIHAAVLDKKTKLADVANADGNFETRKVAVEVNRLWSADESWVMSTAGAFLLSKIPAYDAEHARQMAGMES